MIRPGTEISPLQKCSDCEDKLETHVQQQQQTATLNDVLVLPVERRIETISEGFNAKFSALH